MVVCLAVACLWSLVMLVPVLSHHGWPANHDGIAPLHRMAAIAGQWRAGNLIPVWSTQQQFGYGSPLPGLYHKTFMYLSAAAFAATGSVKAGFVVPLFLCLVSAFCGMCFCVRQALGRRHLAVGLLGGAMFVASNYMTTNWMVRGAFAEVSAMAILPWIFGWCLILLLQGRWPVWIGAAMGLLALSHSSLGLFSLLPLTIALGLAWARWRQQAWAWWKPAVQSTALAVLIVSPFVLPTATLARFNRIDQLTFSPIFTPRSNGIPFQRYLWDPYWTWGADWRGITFQLDLALLLVLPLALGLLVWRRSAAPQDVPGISDATTPEAHGGRWTAAFLLATLAVMAWLQLPQAVWVYEQVPGAAYLQFAWRLSSYLTVVLVLCGCIAVSRIALLGSGTPNRKATTAVAALLAVAMLGWIALPKMWWHRLNYDWHSRDQFPAELVSGDYAAFGEFLPLAHWPPVEKLFETGAQAKAWLAQLPGPSACTVAAADGRSTVEAGERRSGRWSVNCANPSTVPLPVFMAPGMRLSVRAAGDGAWREILPRRTCADPRLQLALQQGQYEVEVRFPTWVSVSRDALSRPVFDYRRDCSQAP